MNQENLVELVLIKRLSKCLLLAQLPGCVPHTTNFVVVRAVAIIVAVKAEYQLLENLSLQNA